MQDQEVPVAIIGGGLSGLYAAFLLEQKGIDYVLLEARDRLGGRIMVAKPSADTAVSNVDAGTQKLATGFDLGPSWFWPDYQPQLSDLIDSLNLARFAQFETGDMMVEHTANEPPARTHGYQSAPPSMRLVGGMAALIDALYARLNPARVMMGHMVECLTKTEHHVEIHSKHHAQSSSIYRAQHVILALPPRLAANLVFQPGLPQGLVDEWQATATWMAPHAKYLAVYDTPFWRTQNLSGSARSAVGPLTEIHDASTHDAVSHDTASTAGSAALFGFFGVPAHIRQSVSESELKAHCRAQLVRLFGVQAATPSAEYLKDWSAESFTAIPADVSGNGQHAVAPTAQPKTGVWQNCLTGSASEWSVPFSGYIAGAIDAADKAVQGLPDSVSVSTSASTSSLNRIMNE